MGTLGLSTVFVSGALTPSTTLRSRGGSACVTNLSCVVLFSRKSLESSYFYSQIYFRISVQLIHMYILIYECSFGVCVWFRVVCIHLGICSWFLLVSIMYVTLIMDRFDPPCAVPAWAAVSDHRLNNYIYILMYIIILT